MILKKTTVERLPIPDAGYAIHWDKNLAGFGVRVTAAGIRTFVFQKRINGTNKRITIGRFGELTAEQARKQAVKLAGQIATGNDPIAEKKQAKIMAVTLSQVFADYLKARKNLKPQTVKDYRRVMDKAFPEWLDRPFLAITKDMVAQRHAKLGEHHGEAWANLSMRLLRALFNFAAGQYESADGRSLISENPVRRLSQTRSWYRVERRQTIIKPHELGTWFNAVNDLENDTLRDYLQLVVLTGLRRNEAAQLKWADVDLKALTLTVRDPKNHRDHTLPLSDFLFDLLARRKSLASNAYVFPGPGSAGYLVEPRKQMARVTQETGIAFTVHDLRRTFITIAESLDIPAYALKRLLNHATGSDVTAGYLVINVERLRDPMQKITDYILKAAGMKATAEVIPFKHARG